MTVDLRNLVGQDIGGFNLTAFLGEGGMAVVFRAENVLNASIVRAIKIVKPEHSARPEFGRRFAEEALFLEKLNHPAVVKFFGLRSTSFAGTNLLLMELELLEGDAISTLIERRRGKGLPLHDAVRWTARACEGVAAAHALGIVHRDLKPENMFLTTAGDVKVLDFGIARVADDVSRSTRLTQEGTMPGSPPFMAPEVCNGAVPTAAADVYALGLGLFEMLLGYHPFAHPNDPPKTLAQYMLAHVQGNLPALRASRADVPAGLEGVLRRAVAKNPADRFPTAREFGEALSRLLATLPPPQDSTASHLAASTSYAVPQFGAPTTTGAAVTTLPATPAAPSRRNALILGMLAGVLVLGGGAAYFKMGRTRASGAARPRGVQSARVPPSTTDASAVGVARADSAAAASNSQPGRNRWIHIAVPTRPIQLGVIARAADRSVRGVRSAPTRPFLSPDAPYDILQHEVTWEELDGWLEAHSAMRFARPAWVATDAAQRRLLPVTGIPWETARSYCRSLSGNLPTEEQWEFAARGTELRPNAWGTQTIDTASTHAFQGPAARPIAVLTSDQDRTPGDDDRAIFDMMGNALEWTMDLYRDDTPGQNESWVQAGGVTFRAVRGLPLAVPLANPPSEGAAYRDALCATGPCPADTNRELQFVGFRCVRRARAAAGG